jgi:hypothetical protein
VDRDPDFANFILGADSPKKLMIKHTGLGIGVSASVSTFPETRSAVVVLSNGLDAGDASDFAAQILIQELFDLKPRVNLMDLVDIEVDRRDREYETSIMAKWRENRDVSHPEGPLEDCVGDYKGLAITLTVRVNKSLKKLELVFNRDDVCVPLEYYNVDKYSYMPSSRDEWLKGGWLDWDYYKIGILDFRRGQDDKIDGLFWQWEKPSSPSWFKKQPILRS